MTLDAAPLRQAAIEIDVVRDTVEGLVGTHVPDDAPLMSAGLDSIAAVELVTTLGQKLSTEIESTALFDHPTIGSLSKHFAVQLRPVVALTAAGSNNETPVLRHRDSCESETGKMRCVLVVAAAFHLPAAE